MNVPSTRPAKRLILIVDDLAENLQVLAGHLNEAGYEVLAANNGPRALALVRNRRPDLILLDIMMPGMDGFTVCRTLKAERDNAEIPVIFITARTETIDVLEGFHAGAVDYVTKPFKSPELLARVHTHLELKAARDLIATTARQLERLNEEKNRFLGIVSHDIRGAFSNVIAVSRMLTDGAPMPAAESAGLLTDIGLEAEHMIALAQNLLNVQALEGREFQAQRERVATRSLIDFVLQAHRLAARAKRLEFNVACDNTPILGDLTLCRQVLTNLVSNAVKYSPVDTRIWIEARRVPAGASTETGQPLFAVQLSVRDEGPGLSEADQRKLFMAYTRLSTKVAANEHSVGLGLSIVKLMAEAMGGHVRCESRLGAGATFCVTLPVAEGLDYS